jgi:AcrR family transcriptional regulator
MIEWPYISSMSVQGIRVGGRSERVVADVLRATLAELGRAGYAGLRVDAIAEQAGVNKTTIYRRWPTKAALVEAAIRSLRGATVAPDTGSVTGDLVALAAGLADRAQSPEKRSLSRVILAELDHPEVAAIARSLRAEAQAEWLAAVERGIVRGELPNGTDPALVVELIWGPILARLRANEAAPREWIAGVVRIVVRGVVGSLPRRGA